MSKSTKALSAKFSFLLPGDRNKELKGQFEAVHTCVEGKQTGNHTTDRFAYIYEIAHQKVITSNHLGEDQTEGLLRVLQQYWQEYTGFFV